MGSSSPAIRIRVAACVTEGERLLLVQHQKRGRRYWLLPGGGVELHETLTAALRRELMEETGLSIEVGRLVIVCEVIEPAGRHILNLVFAARVTGGELSARRDGAVVDARWHRRDSLRSLVSHPHIVEEILACWAEGFEGPVRVLGDVWQPI